VNAPRGEFGDKGLNRVAPDGTLVREGPEFDLHLAGNLSDAARQGTGISATGQEGGRE
jgi:hypothetical protein